MIVCILAIATMITLAVVLNNNNDTDTVLKPIVSGDDNSGNIPPVNNPDDKDPNNGDTNKPPTKLEFVMSSPLDEYTIAKSYSEDHVLDLTLGAWHPHEGIDFSAAKGSNVKCVFDGTVKEVTSGDSHKGTTVTIEHQDGFTTVYKYLDGVTLKVGDKVSKGAVIGKVSGTAEEEIADGPHMHLELFKDGKRINPLEYLLTGDK